jgi:hypothetical protein
VELEKALCGGWRDYQFSGPAVNVHANILCSTIIPRRRHRGWTAGSSNPVCTISTTASGLPLQWSLDQSRFL